MEIMIPCPFCSCTSIGTYSKPFNDAQSISHLIYCECNGCGARTKGVKAIEVEDETDFWTVNEEKSQIAKDRWNNRAGDATTKINIQDAKIVAEIMRIGRVVDELKLHNNIVVQEHNQPNDYDSYVITAIKKYEGRNMTLAEIYDKDAKWLNWVAKNFKPRGEKALKDVNAIRMFMKDKPQLEDDDS